MESIVQLKAVQGGQTTGQTWGRTCRTNWEKWEMPLITLPDAELLHPEGFPCHCGNVVFIDWLPSRDHLLTGVSNT